ncbi:hypothetical protein N431DRAFT_489764 [Stipitochalara longipes BDJ]|nr:hypothetical protein N431DRAFT_489764 [Stipitochalara longipes BDJ]
MHGPALLTICLALAKAIIAVPYAATQDFENNYGYNAALIAAPLWHMASGTCMPSAAEDGQGHQTNGVDTDNCNINKLGHNCPPQPAWSGPNTGYYNIPGEPFANIPTYFKTQYCSNLNQWRVLYYVYFKKDTGHKSDWEGAVVVYEQSGESWVGTSIFMEQDGSHPSIPWGSIPNTFDGTDDWEQDGNTNRGRPKLYFGKWHHSVHQNMYTAAFKNTCPPTSDTDFRNNDYQFWSYWNLRSAEEYLPTSWDWGKANSPSTIDLCNY